jgi:D-ornithine---citrate ligase
MNAIPKLYDAATDSHQKPFSAAAWHQAKQHGLQRTLQALFRENLLPRENLLVEGSVALLPLWSQQGLLRFEGLQIGRIGDCRLSGSVSYYKKGDRPHPVPTAAALLACIADSLPGGTSTDDLQRLTQELNNSMENDALCLNYRATWAQELTTELGSAWPCFIAALRHSAVQNTALLLEQWGTVGHPWHPMHKCKLGLTADEVVALSPEFQPVLQIPLVAIRSNKAHITLSNDSGNYPQWFAHTFPQIWFQWQTALRQMQQDPIAWLPLPLHPYQAQQVITQKFAKEIAMGDLVLLSDVSFAASPTMSFRTVVPQGSVNLPHVKLPVSLRLTSVQRTVSPKSAVMGPRLTRLLNTIVADEKGFDGTLDIVAEDVGLHYIDPNNDDDRARHLSVLFRANPMSKCTADLFPVPVGCLFADSPFGGRPIIADLVGLSFGDHPKGAIDFFEHYATTILTATLSAYLLYGIAFEAHQQNSFIMVNQRYEPVQLLVRDFGDLRVHGPTLQRTGLELIAYRAGYTVFESVEPVRDKLLHAVMLCHVAEIALLLSHIYQHPAEKFWAIFRRKVEKVFDQLQARTEPQRWKTERHALLESDWPAKSFFRMRLSNTSDDVHGQMPNPLTKPAS